MTLQICAPIASPASAARAIHRRVLVGWGSSTLRPYCATRGLADATHSTPARYLPGTRSGMFSRPTGVEVSKTLDDLKRLTNDIMPTVNAS